MAGKARKISIILITLLILGALFFALFKIYNKLKIYYLSQSAPESALEYYEKERDFIDQYVRDPKGGFYYWVERNGSVKDSKKYSLFQSNIILWLGGLESQKHDDKNLILIKDAADYLVKYLYKGKGEWFEFDSQKHHTKQDFFWNPRSETYISFALLEAYRLTEDQKYLDTAVATNKRQRDKFPDAHIFAEYDPTKEIGQRFPEHMGHLQEYRITGNVDALNYARKIDQNYRGIFGRENVNPDGSVYYYHGMAVLDKLIYGILDGNEDAYREGSIGRESYWSMSHDDSKKFNPSTPGESSDNGRDYYDKRIAMDLLEWTKTNDDVYRQDAVDLWDEVKGFWDINEPYGFLINAEEDRKTCFTIGMPQMLFDLTGPVVKQYFDESKSFFNHQMKVVMYDQDYDWNDISMRGIGLDEPTIKLDIPFGFQYGSAKSIAGPCEGCFTYEVNYLKFLPGKVNVTANDYFGNKGVNPVKVGLAYTFWKWDNLNQNSLWLYSIITISVSAFILLILLLFLLFSRKSPQRDHLPNAGHKNKKHARK